MKKNRVTKRTLDKNARKFSDLSNAAWNDLCAFANSHCRGEKKREAFLEELCVIVDKYIDLNCKIIMWCHKNGVDPMDFMCDVVNMGSEHATGAKK